MRGDPAPVVTQARELHVEIQEYLTRRDPGLMRQALEAAGKMREEVRAAIKAARARLNGGAAAVPLTLGAWLHGLPPAEQDMHLGQTKGRLFRAGQFTKTRELVAQANQSPRPEEL